MCSSKFRGTPVGIPAIEEMLYEGIPINITLLFALKDYGKRGAGLHHAPWNGASPQGKPINNVASVASFLPEPHRRAR